MQKSRNFYLNGCLYNELIESIKAILVGARNFDSVFSQFSSNIERCFVSPFGEKHFFRLDSNRNIFPESLPMYEFYSEIDKNGNGITTMIGDFLNKSGRDHSLVQKNLLNDLNHILQPDKIDDIFCRAKNGNLWEIYLRDHDKGDIPLSESGSGLKTIISILCYLHLLPVAKNIKLENCIFAFEEVENNLHPATLRRLLRFIEERSLRHGFIVFLTTHSSVEIDYFATKQHAQIIHVQSGETGSIATECLGYHAHTQVLDDLGLRASDILQTNYVIWVEGPSDRIYLNRWIELWSEGELCEGLHYQCIFYGGALLSHYSADAPSDDPLIDILNVCRNAAIVMDSDKLKQDSPLKERVQKILDETSDHRSRVYSWVTHGKEIENYIAVEAVCNAFNKDVRLRNPKRFENFYKYFAKNVVIPNSYEQKKVDFAKKVAPCMTLECQQSVSDLDDNMKKLCSAIRRANNIVIN